MHLEVSKGPFAVSYLNFTTNMASIALYERGYHSDTEIEDRIALRNKLASSEEKLA